jgi:hypothetical protein
VMDTFRAMMFISIATMLLCYYATIATAARACAAGDIAGMDL